VLEYLEAQINAREDVEDLRDTERAVAYVRELMGGEDLEPLETTEILEVGDLLVWRQLKLDLAKLSWHKPRSELRNNEGDEQVDAPPIIEKSREEIQAKPETIEELIQALKDDEMMLWAAEQLDTKNLDDDAKMKALKTLFKGRSIPTQLKTARLANLAFRIVLLKRPHEAYFFEGIPDIALYPDLMEFLTETVMERVRGIKASTILNIANPEEHPILLRKSAEALEQSALEIDQLVSEAGLQISYKAGPTIKKVDPKILFLSPETLKENLRILSARGIDHVSYEALLIASTEKLAANLNLLIDSYGFTAMEAAQVAANATRTLIINHGLLTALQIPVTARLMKETSKHLIARIRSGKLKSDLPVASVERILKEFESFSDGIREQFNHRSELRRFQNQIDDVLVRLKQEERLSSVPELYSALKDLTGRYAVILDVKHFRLFSKKQRQEFYKAFSLYDQNKKIRFVFYAAEDEPLDEVLQELLDFSRVFKQLKVVSKLANVDFKDRLVLNFSKQGSVSVSRQYFEESLSKAKKRFDIIYRSRDQEGLLLAALLLLESGNEAVVRNQMALRNIANQLNSQIQQLLEAFHYIGRSA
jgi:hypothetical protein